jgi:excisionase family DNA binding protein
MKELHPVMTGKQMAEYLGISKNSGYRLANEKQFPTIRVGAKMLIVREHFLEWLDKQAGYHKRN